MQFSFANTNLKFFAFLFGIWLFNIPAIILFTALSIAVTSIVFPCATIGPIIKYVGEVFQQYTRL